MKRIGIISGAIILLTLYATPQDLRENINRSLFSDKKAFTQGDAITIIVVETSSATRDSRTRSSRQSDISVGGSGSLFDENLGSGDLSIGTGSSFRGEGAMVSRGDVRAYISASVDSVLANGNLMISGKRKIVVNNQKQEMTISGIVRPSDILPDNSVLSYNISDASIYMKDSGIVARTRSPGLLTRLFHWLF